MKYCEYCNRELTKEQHNNKYCSNECFQNARRDKKIKDWQNGKFNGIRGTNQISMTIRTYLLEKNNYKCQRCGWGEINPFSNTIPLEIHHIDGDYQNNSENNLEVLCPNCHSLTENYKSLNRDSNRELNVTRKALCVDCGIPISQGALRCVKCNGKHNITEKPISRDELKTLIRTQPFTKIGEQFNLTDNGIRKWCKSFDLPTKKKDIKQYTDEEWELL